MEDGKGPDPMDLKQVERDRTVSRRFEVDKTIDRTTITIASGAIALSVTILEKGGLSANFSLIMLYLSWTLLVLCVLAVLWSMNESRKALFAYVELIDTGADTARQSMARSATRTGTANKVSMALLIVGLGAMLLAFGFAFRGEPMGKNRRLDEGFVIQPNSRVLSEPTRGPANRGHQLQANPAVVGQGGSGTNQQSGSGSGGRAQPSASKVNDTGSTDKP